MIRIGVHRIAWNIQPVISREHCEISPTLSRVKMIEGVLLIVGSL